MVLCPKRKKKWSHFLEGNATPRTVHSADKCIGKPYRYPAGRPWRLGPLQRVKPSTTQGWSRNRAQMGQDCFFYIRRSILLQQGYEPIKIQHSQTTERFRLFLVFLPFMPLTSRGGNLDKFGTGNGIFEFGWTREDLKQPWKPNFLLLVVV